MIVFYFKQAWQLLKENPLISIISIIGTALAISMIMVIVLTMRVETVNFPPESNRDRSLYVTWMSTYWNDDPSWSSSGPMSVRTAKECFKALTIPEAVTMKNAVLQHVASSAEGDIINVDLVQTDEAFWKVFDFQFLNGKPFDYSDVESGITKAVITESVARKLFGTTEVTGRTVHLDYTDYTISGVVKDVSELANTAYAEVWIPYTTTNLENYVWSGNVMGLMHIVILARSADDFPAIRNEVISLMNKYNEELPDNQKVQYREQPDTQFVYNNRKDFAAAPDMQRIVAVIIIVIVLLLIVPAINLSGMTLSRMRKRYPEIGVRKAFGASMMELLLQILTENFLLTIIGGVIGLIITYGASVVLKDMLFNNALLTPSLMLDPLLFLLAFFFCLILNLLSAGIPAWRAARMNIVAALTA